MFHLVGNPTAKKGEAVLTEVLRRLEERGVEFDVYRPKDRSDALEYVHTITSEGGQTVVAVGGDGTLNAVLEGIADPSSTTLGLIPAGTGNDFAAAAKIPLGADAVELLLSGEAKPTDYLQCGERRSMNIAGLGIDVDIIERCERKRKNGKKNSYFKSLLISLCTYKGVGMTVEVDGEAKEYRALLAAACNGQQFGGGIPICKPAVLDDGLLDIVVVDCPKRIKLPYYLILLMKGKILTRKICHHTLCKSVKIRPHRAGNVQLDGELYPAEELTVEIVSGKLKMYRG